jgi:serine/threonine protein kinase
MRRPQWFGPYRLLYRVSSGGMAEVFRALYMAPDGRAHDVAVKRILPCHTSDPEFIDMLIDEAKIAGQLDHANIARLYEFGVVDESYFLAMEFVDGVDLRSIMRRCRERDVELPVEYAVYAIEQALRGLHCAHEQMDDDGRPMEIIHRDFSPSNLLVGYDGRVRLIDFGIAKARLNRAKTRAGVIKGKVKYMSPEQTWGKRLDRRSDVFAAGVVLYEAVTGNPPFHAPDDVALMDAIRAQEPDPPSRQNPRLDAAFDGLLAKALSKEPDARFATAGEFADALAAYRQRRFPRFDVKHLGTFLARIFARERMEAEELYGEYDLGAPPEDVTPTGQRAHYTRLVDLGGLAEGSGPREAEGLNDEIDAWLARRRASAPPDDAADEGAWTPGERPGWVVETERTQEMDALRPSAPIDTVPQFEPAGTGRHDEGETSPSPRKSVEK